MNSNQPIQLSAFQAAAMEYNRIQDRNESIILHIPQLLKALWKGFTKQYSVSIIETRTFINDPRHKNSWTEDFLKRALTDRKISLQPLSNRNILSDYHEKSGNNNRHDKRSTGLPFTVFNATTDTGKPFTAQILNGLPGYALRKFGFTDNQLAQMKKVTKNQPLSFIAARQLFPITHEDYKKQNNTDAYILGQSMSKVKMALVKLPGQTEPILCAAKKAQPGNAFADEAAVKREIALQNQSDCAPKAYGYTSTVNAAGKKQFIIFMDIARGTGAGKLRHENAAKKLLLANDMLTTLCRMHRNGVYPCDIKEDNIIFSKEGKAQFIDFGHASVNPLNTIFHYNNPYLATNYAPECATSQQNLWETKRTHIHSPKADMFAVGSFLTSFLGDRQLFANGYWVPMPPDAPKDNLQKARKIIGPKYELVPIRSGNDLQTLIDNDLEQITLHPEVRTLIAKMLKVDPSQRIDAEAAARELNQIIQKDH
ncbi:protein kinase domain-containing protein [Endozoicomonas ascidiicola]|uniref:protein kinase domain-containing protein n=1 Tax=Endozoicomonas ascidiicola TaxID=1698521 RepID=UPI00082FFD36|nr:hypothetical protein [Endozoicomonas ascidiicola]